MRWNREAFEAYELLPKMLVDVSGRSQSIELFGKEYASPFGISPVGLGALYHFDGDVKLALAAAAKNIPYILSGASLTKLEKVAKFAPDIWFQAYLPGDNHEIRRLLERVSSAGIRNLVITVDVPLSVNPDRYARFGFSSPLRPSLDLIWQGITHPRWSIGTFGRHLMTHGMPHLENWRADRGNPILSASVQKNNRNRDNFTWNHIQFIRKHWDGNLIIKGVLTVEDAIAAQNIGADGIIVSNHGGRQADGVVSALKALEEIMNSTPKLVVMMDGGIRRGTDILKAMGLGAKCVFAGRPFNFALAAGGGNGVLKAISILQEEVDRNMAHLGMLHPSQILEGRMRKR